MFLHSLRTQYSQERVQHWTNSWKEELFLVSSFQDPKAKEPLQSEGTTAALELEKLYEGRLLVYYLSGIHGTQPKASLLVEWMGAWVGAPIEKGGSRKPEPHQGFL